MMSPGDIKSRFGSAVRTRRKGLGISQEELAGRAGLHRTYVADVERGARNLSLGSIEKLARALEISLPALFAHAVDGGLRVPEGHVEILLVEPDLATPGTMREMLRTERLHNVIRVMKDGAEALEHLFGSSRPARAKPEHRPQLIFLDLNLPRINAFDLLRQIRNDSRTQSIPVVIMAEAQQQQEVAEAMRAGATASVTKPVDFSRLAATVRQLRLGWTLVRPPP